MYIYVMGASHRGAIIGSDRVMIKLERRKVVDVKIDHEAITLSNLNRIEALEAALTEAHRIILHELDNGRTPYLLPVDNGGKGLGYFEDVLAGIER